MLRYRLFGWVGAVLGFIVGFAAAYVVSGIAGLLYLFLGFEFSQEPGLVNLVAFFLLVTGGVLGGRRGRRIARSWRPIEAADDNDP